MTDTTGTIDSTVSTDNSTTLINGRFNNIARFIAEGNLDAAKAEFINLFNNEENVRQALFGSQDQFENLCWFADALGIERQRFISQLKSDNALDQLDAGLKECFILHCERIWLITNKKDMLSTDFIRQADLLINKINSDIKKPLIRDNSDMVALLEGDRQDLQDQLADIKEDRRKKVLATNRL